MCDQRSHLPGHTGRARRPSQAAETTMQARSALFLSRNQARLPPRLFGAFLIKTYFTNEINAINETNKTTPKTHPFHVLPNCPSSKHFLMGRAQKRLAGASISCEIQTNHSLEENRLPCTPVTVS
ncbi:hypothetical protein SCOR_14825 [Sulfidibacter corallicola]